MSKTLLYVLLSSVTLATSSGCHCLNDWMYRGDNCGISRCGGCNQAGCGFWGRYAVRHRARGCASQCGSCDTCLAGPVTRDRCGLGTGCGFGGFDLFGWGCGETYWGDYRSDPPAPCEPCDNHGNWIGPTYHRAGRMQATTSGGCGCGASHGPTPASYSHGPTPASHSHGSSHTIHQDGMPVEVQLAPGEKLVPHSAKHTPTPAKRITSRPRVAY